MNKIHFLFSVLGLSLLTLPSAFAQLDNNQSQFDEFMDRSGNVYRSASGKPGPEYFQNEADYTIKAELNPETHIIRGQITMTYTNNSPEDLDYIWMYLEQNRFTEDSRGTLTTPIGGNRYDGDPLEGVKISNLKAEVRRSTSSKHLISDTRMQVFFDKPLKADGGEAEVSMNFEFEVPVNGMDRMGRLSTKNGEIYAIAQWFPQVAVFDDIEGWNVEPYLGAGEFYYDYGEFDVEITVPHNYLVVASGELQNPKDVLSSEVYDRYKKALESEETVTLISSEEIGDPAMFDKQSGTQTWHYKIENSRDFAFATSKAFIWDAAQFVLPSGKTGLAHSAYPIESNGQNAWSRSTEYSKASIEYYSKKWYEYPYPAAVNVAADIGGMEYPGLNFCSWKSTGAGLWGVTDHEFGHNWFPMIVGSNERRYAWMDEGFNTFINYYSTKAFNEGEYPTRLNQPRTLTGWFLSEEREGIDTYPDVANLRNLGMIAYYKPALGLVTLREYILGEERFDYAFKSYIETWAFKHPQPKDFFNHIENAAGENLSWFFEAWFYGTGNIDLAIDSLRKREGAYYLTVSNRGDIPMPVHMQITFEDGTTEMKSLPVEIWQRGDTWTHKFESKKDIKSVEIDPEKILLDVNFSNDSWPVEIYKD